MYEYVKKQKEQETVFSTLTSSIHDDRFNHLVTFVRSNIYFSNGGHEVVGTS